jgi:hypothetical protein
MSNYILNVFFPSNLDGSDKSQHHHHHHHHPPSAQPPTHYSSFYPEMVAQPTAEPVDLASAAEYDKERQTIEKCLSKLSLPIVRKYFFSLETFKTTLSFYF